MENRLIIHTDGGARGNPGPAAIGVVIEQEGKIIHEFGKKIGETTNNVAEYTAVIEALRFLKKTGDNEPAPTQIYSNRGEQGTKINFFLDSKLVVEQLNGNYKIKDSKLRELSLQVRMIEQDLSADRQKLGSVITYAYVPREQNKRADLMVNQALDQ